MKSNIEKLGETLNKRMQQTISARTGVIAELGTITGNMGLQVSSVGNTIPKGDYLISRHLSIGKKDSTLTTTKSGQGNHGHGPSGGHSQEIGTGTHSHPSSEGEHVHEVLVPETLQGLKAGDRVLVIWCGYEPVVADILIES